MRKKSLRKIILSQQGKRRRKRHIPYENVSLKVKNDHYRRQFLITSESLTESVKCKLLLRFYSHQTTKESQWQVTVVLCQILEGLQIIYMCQKHEHWPIYSLA
jgi:hypothetical protein